MLQENDPVATSCTFVKAYYGHSKSKVILKQELFELFN